MHMDYDMPHSVTTQSILCETEPATSPRLYTHTNVLFKWLRTRYGPDKLQTPRQNHVATFS